MFALSAATSWPRSSAADQRRRAGHVFSGTGRLPGRGLVGGSAGSTPCTPWTGWAPGDAIAWFVLSADFPWRSAVGVVRLCLPVRGGRQLRPVYIRELEDPAAKPTWHQGGRVPIGDDPFRWREPTSTADAGRLQGVLAAAGFVAVRAGRFYHSEIGVGRAQRLALWPGVLLTAALTTISSLPTCRRPAAEATLRPRAGRRHLDFGRLRAMAPVGAENGFQLQGLVAMLQGSFVVGIRCSGAVTGEREQQTWEAVLLTPLDGEQLVHGKLWGVMSACYWYLLAYAAPTLLLSALAGIGSPGGRCLAGDDGAGDVLHGAAGVWCSARWKTSWRSLLARWAGLSPRVAPLPDYVAVRRPVGAAGDPDALGGGQRPKRASRRPR